MAPLDTITALELLMRGAAAGAYVGLAILAMREGLPLARLSVGIMCLGAASHALIQMPGMHQLLGWAFIPLWALSAMLAGLFWAFVREVFGDRKQTGINQYAPSLVLLALAAVIRYLDGNLQEFARLGHNLLSAVLILHALLVIAQGWMDDLVEKRRRWRGFILTGAALYGLAVVAVQTTEVFFGDAHNLSPVAAIALALLAIMSLVAFARLEPEFFNTQQRLTAADGARAAGLVPSGDEIDVTLVTALETLVTETRAYRDHTLTIAQLAQQLGLPEHGLRKLINHHLGYRNFSAYINERRIAEAREALADMAQRDVPVSTIALDTGFGSLGPFNRAFKTATGLTPSEYRARELASKS